MYVGIYNFRIRCINEGRIGFEILLKARNRVCNIADKRAPEIKPRQFVEHGQDKSQI